MPGRTKGSVLYNSWSLPQAPSSFPAFLQKHQSKSDISTQHHLSAKITGFNDSEPIAISLPGAETGPGNTLFLTSSVPQQKEVSIIPDLGCSKGANEREACSLSVLASTSQVEALWLAQPQSELQPLNPKEESGKHIHSINVLKYLDWEFISVLKVKK